MYSEGLKKEYIKYKEEKTVLPEGHLKKLFELTSELETELDKDICNFTVNEIEHFYSRINSPSADWLRVLTSSLRQYTQWCFERGLVYDGQNHFNEFDYNKLLNQINKAAFDYSIITREQINEWIKALYNPCDKFIIEALYEGINGKQLCELTDIRITDFDFKNHTLILHSNNETKREISVSEQLCRIARDAAMEKYFYPNNGEGAKSGDSLEYQKDETLVLKNHPKSEPGAKPATMARRLKTKILRIAEYMDAPYLNSMVIINSGKLNYVIERCKELGITGEEFLYSEHVNDLIKQFNCKSFNRSTFLKKYREYLA